MQYYVIKDKKTSRYFRGKGVNRWGKYFNQASIYRVLGQAEENLDHIKRTRKVHNDLEADPVIVPIQITENEVEQGGWYFKEVSRKSCSITHELICRLCGYKVEMLQGRHFRYCPRCGSDTEVE